MSEATDLRFERVLEVVRREMQRLPIPGVALGILRDGHESIAGLGVTSIENPLPVTPDTLFQIGSITKTYVGTLVMRLVEQGKVNLDAPLRMYLPDFELRDADAAANATLRHLLTHTGGWEGDYFDDFGRGDDALARMVAKMRELPQLTPLGQVWSYNNAGFYLVGRVIEVVTGTTFEAAMQALIFEPLQLTNSFFFAEDVISRRFVVGHYDVNGQAQVARPWALARTAHPAGGIVCSIPDLFKYARLHLGDGSDPDGTRLLTRASLDAMQTPLYPATDPEWVGLSWFLRDYGSVRAFGHSGGTNGQVTRLLILPAHHMAAAIFTNSEHGGILVNTVLNAILETYLAISPAAKTHLTRTAAELAPYLGRYEAAADFADIALQGDMLQIQITDRGGFPVPSSPPAPAPPPPVRAALYADDKIILLDDPFKDNAAQFLRGADGAIEWLRLFGRIHRRL